MSSKIKEKYLEFKEQKLSKTSTYVGLSDDIALSILKALQKLNISNVEFAKKIGKEPSVISKWLNGQHNFTLKTIVDIENALNQKIVYPSIKINKNDIAAQPFVVLHFDLNNNDFAKVNSQNLFGKKVSLTNNYDERIICLNT